MFIDSHCHLDFSVFDDHRDRLMARCLEQNISGFLVPATRYSTWSNLALLAKNYPYWRVAYGLHPYFLASESLDAIDLIGEHCEQASAVAVGEIGLDYWPGAVDKSIQLDFFRRQLSMAKVLSLPVILHARKSYDEVLACLRALNFQQGGVVHAFNGSLVQAERFIALGFVLGIGGTVTYPRAKKAHRVLAGLDKQAFVLETDAPDMPLMGYQGQLNTPLSIPLIAHAVSAIREESVEQIATQTYNNLLRVFPTWHS
ncbi:TatD family hydrolase [Marinomonas algarum]|uniref:TatD family hydrolase n=1 Tax=Marinomonas algarum TaxID=2883105 RepID=A0A9X1ILU8_9GAMM|nr:TatD family hydrolase [Marinomonas algarum]MCB5161600.1 TatD family hydrolase [Marinomonas algarum]